MSKKNKKTVNGMLIGEYVQNSIQKLNSLGKIYDSELVNLQNEEYCKIKFDLNYPMFKKSSESRLDDLGNARYYQEEKIPGYWFTNDWYEKHWDYYLKWESNKLNS